MPKQPSEKAGPLKKLRKPWRRPKRMRDRRATISTLVSKLARVQLMAPSLPDAIVEHMKRKGKTAQEIIRRVSTVNHRATELILGIENRLLQLRVSPETIEKLVEAERRRLSIEPITRELDALQAKHAGKEPKYIPKRDWQRMLALAHQLNELGKTKP